MTEQNEIDARLAAQFEKEHRHIPADAFCATTMQKVRSARRGREAMRIGLRAVALVAIIAGSPWLISAGTRLSAALESSYAWTLGLPIAWVLGVLAIVVVVAMQVRGR